MALGAFGAFGPLGGEGGAIMCVCFKADTSDYGRWLFLAVLREGSTRNASVPT